MTDASHDRQEGCAKQSQFPETPVGDWEMPGCGEPMGSVRNKANSAGQACWGDLGDSADAQATLRNKANLPAGRAAGTVTPPDWKAGHRAKQSQLATRAAGAKCFLEQGLQERQGTAPLRKQSQFALPGMLHCAVQESWGDLSCETKPIAM
jgi:hypothetical protein